MSIKEYSFLLEHRRGGQMFVFTLEKIYSTIITDYYLEGERFFSQWLQIYIFSGWMNISKIMKIIWT